MSNRNRIHKFDQPAIRILHVTGAMVRDGSETWLMHILRHIDRDRFHIDFLVHTTESCPYDQEIRDLGSHIIPCLDPSKPLMYAANFQRILREHGPYDIIHSHVHHFSGYVLRLAKQAGIPIRIAHSHIDTSTVEASAGLPRQLYLRFMRHWIHRYATYGLACSRIAAANLFSQSWEKDSRWQIIHYGIDLNPFANIVDSASVRAELGIPEDAFVIGHVGRFDEQKNHRFLIEIAAEIAQREPKMCLLLVGKGQLRQQVEQQVTQLGLIDKVIFAEARSDVPRLMRGAMDIFLLPSLYEGLPLVGIEAQAAGLPLIISDAISTELDQVKPLIKRLSLSQSASVWAEAVLAMLNPPEEINPLNSRLTMEDSQFNLSHSVNTLINVYETQRQ